MARLDLVGFKQPVGRSRQ